jgi:hypothetical protein
LPKQTAVWNLAYFAFILTTLVTLGGVLENRREFVKLEFARAALVCAAVMATGSWFGGVHIPAVVLAIAGWAAASAIALVFTVWRNPATAAAERVECA